MTIGQFAGEPFALTCTNQPRDITLKRKNSERFTKRPDATNDDHSKEDATPISVMLNSLTPG